MSRGIARAHVERNPRCRGKDSRRPNHCNRAQTTVFGRPTVAPGQTSANTFLQASSLFRPTSGSWNVLPVPSLPHCAWVDIRLQNPKATW